MTATMGDRFNECSMELSKATGFGKVDWLMKNQMCSVSPCSAKLDAGYGGFCHNLPTLTA